MNRELPSRFTQQYILDRVVEDENGCWIWQKSKHDHGYGQLGVWPYTTHVLAYRLWKGIPEGVVRHVVCNNPPCCNPDHLKDGTHQANWWDSELSHRESMAKHRWRRNHRAQKIRIYGEVYQSKDEARTKLKISYERLLRDCEVL